MKAQISSASCPVPLFADVDGDGSVVLSTDHVVAVLSRMEWHTLMVFVNNEHNRLAGFGPAHPGNMCEAGG